MDNSKILGVIDARLLAAALALTMSMAGCSGGGSTMTSGSQSPALPAGLGGSNYLTYHLDPPCSREPYGVVYNYDTATATINAQLQQMYTNGQRRLRILIFHGRGAIPEV
jgi:hypothetical protein